MRSDLTRRTILQAVGAGALACSTGAGAAPQSGGSAGTPKLCLELSGRLQATALAAAGMRRVKQLGVDHGAICCFPLVWQQTVGIRRKRDDS
jgi:hypothetical protein